MQRLNYPDIAPAGPTYNRAVRAGNWLFISGCTAKNSPIQGGPMIEQARVTLDRIRRIVEAEGGTTADIVRITTYVTDIEQWRALAKEREALMTECFQGQFPANTLVEIGALAEPGLDVEIEATALLDGRPRPAAPRAGARRAAGRRRAGGRRAPAGAGGRRGGRTRR
jgi:2-iminobutanoate/2-iminopropanoate deaminase